MNIWTNASLAGALLVSLGACGAPIPEPAGAPGVAMQRMTVTSGNFVQGSSMPVDESCDGKDGSPSLVWSTPPEGTKSLALVVDDLDSNPNGFTHWLLYDLPPTMTKLPEGFEPNAEQGKVGVNDFKNARYNGPCPPRESFHRYRFRILALDAMSGLSDGANREQLSMAMNGHVVGVGALQGTFAH